MRYLLIPLVTLASMFLAGSAAQDQAQESFPIAIGIILPPAQSGGVSEQIDAYVRESADMGVEMAIEELGFNAQILGYELMVEVEEAAGAEDADAAAQKLIEEGAMALAGGYGPGVAAAIAAQAQEAGVPFLNIGSPSPLLRNEQCSAWMFHIEPSGGMYLDALAGWYVGSGFRNWHLITGEGAADDILVERLERALRDRHFGARVSGRSTVDGSEESYVTALEEGSEADVIVLFPRGDVQLEILAVAEAADVDVELTAFPWPETQTREYYREALEAAPGRATHRTSAWEPTLDAYGARELNARFEGKFNVPMDAPAWAAYQAVKLVFEAVSFGGVRDEAALRDHFADEDAVFDVWKGIGVTFRPWNNQMRQTLFLVELVPEAESPRDRALLVGELPAIYMPQTDPVERLDQLGDLRSATACQF